MLTGALTAYSYHGLVVDPGSLPGAVWARWLQSWLYIPAWFGGLTIPLYLVPNGALPSRRWRPVMGALVRDTGRRHGLDGVRAGCDRRDRPCRQPPQLKEIGPLLEVVDLVATSLSLAGFGLGIVAVVVRWREENGRTRRQLAYILAAAL